MTDGLHAGCWDCLIVNSFLGSPDLLEMCTVWSSIDFYKISLPQAATDL